ncbi:hypothetical protein [Neorhizobium sp. NCHU2750]|uniref:hypothetical protein n=1 Tax=Neorhizobium sp. NCHU2750 TaxID=1825976 RepID=UPI000E70A5D3|nr:hypothetical protein NCHU2750_45080 [Neorhizobium sp. NCHU2750]
MMQRWSSWWKNPSLLGLGLLAGCCTGVTTDPREGGLAGGICGTTTGAYDQRVASLTARANTLDTANARLSASLRDSDRQLSRLDREIAAKRTELAKVRADLQRLAELAGQRQRLRAEIAASLAKASDRERLVMAIENGIRTAENETRRQEAARELQEIPVGDLIQQVKNIRASIEQ